MNRRLMLPLCLIGLLAATAAARPTPRPQLARRLADEDDVIGIVHWGLNTYTDREWGYGDEDPAILNPDCLDADQIVGACRAGGLRGLVVVAKHHDGFCLWPTKTTDYNITKSPFRGGRGDYVREMSEACRRAGRKFGVYVSPWDRNSAKYGTDAYVEMFHAQVVELLNGDYGDVFEMWFDAANGGDGFYGGAREKRLIRVGYYRFDRMFPAIRKLQPAVCIFADIEDDSDFRYPGTERGLLGPNSRATIDTTGGYANRRYGNPDYRAHRKTGVPDGAFFRMCEADFPLRHGWFYHAKDDGRSKSGEYLMKLYLYSVGNGGTVDIGIAVNRRGVVCEEDVKSLRVFGELRKAFFAREVKDAGAPFNLVVMRENLADGEQVDGWEFVADGELILSGESIGYKRIRLLPAPISPKTCELKITASGGKAHPVLVRRYYVDPAIAQRVIDSSTESGETETVKYLFPDAK